jgi:hypothetical protein
MPASITTTVQDLISTFPERLEQLQSLRSEGKTPLEYDASSQTILADFHNFINTLGSAIGTLRRKKTRWRMVEYLTSTSTRNRAGSATIQSESCCDVLNELDKVETATLAAAAVNLRLESCDAQIGLISHHLEKGLQGACDDCKGIDRQGNVGISSDSSQGLD